MKKLMKNLLGAVALSVGLTLASGAAQGMGHEKYILVSHAPDSDSWWNTIKNGLALAGKQMGVQVEYRNPPTGDLADMTLCPKKLTEGSHSFFIKVRVA